MKPSSQTRRRTFLEEKSDITTPGNTPGAITSARARSEASVVRPKSTVIATSTAKQSASRKKAGKAKPELITPEEFARRLQEQVTETDSSSLLPPPQTSQPSGRKARQSSSKLPIKAVQPPQYLKGHVIFYTGGDLTYASARTRGCMNYVRVLFVTFNSYVNIPHRFTNMVGSCFQNLILQRPRTSSQKQTRKIRFALLASRACRKYPKKYRRYIGAG
jgi:hypothetical protein